MPFIYEPKGRAREYAELALNLYGGSCAHGCTYCYARNIPGFKDEPPRPRKGLIEALEHKEAKKHAGREIHLCFTCDMFQPGHLPAYNGEAIDILLANGCNISILTKAGAPITTEFLRHYVEYADRIRYGATLTMDHHAMSRQWEPGAALPDDRTRALREIHGMGFKTWVSFEPVLHPTSTLNLMRRVAPYVDLYKIGRWNHDPRADAIDWRQFREDAVALCESLGKQYTLKQDLINA